MTKLVTNTSRLHAAEQVLESISEVSNTAYYLFVADHTSHANAELQPVYDYEKTNIDVYRNMIFGKRVEETDLKIMIRNVPYVSNVVYDMYDDSDTEILTKDFFVVVNAASFYHIYKCLDNNNGAASLNQPDFSHISGTNTFIYQTADGYRWKYMYSVDSANVVKFETTDYFPVIANTTVSDQSVQGAIDIVKVDGEGRGYDNYSSGTFIAADIKVDGDAQLYALSNGSASAVNGFYTGCNLYLSSGTGSGQYVTVTNYYSNSTGRYMATNTEFTTVPDGTTEYQLNPTVQIIGDGKETVNAVARALVNSVASNSIYRVEMLSRGAGYQYITGNVVANAVVGVTSNAIVRPIYGPYKGHGYDASDELGARHLSFTVKISNTESDTITIDNDFQQVGIIKDPMFANVEVETKNGNGSFITNELVYKIKPVRLQTGTSTTIATQNVDSNDPAASDFDNQLSAGDWVYLNSSTGLQHQVAQVGSVTNSSQFILAVNAYFSCTDVVIYQANVSSNAYVQSSNATYVWLTNVSGQLLTDDLLIGSTSGAKAQVNVVSRNGDPKTFDTYQNLYKYIGTLDSGSFNENEIIYQDSINTSNALVHSSVVNGASITLYTSNQVGQFIADGANSVFGNDSGAVASFTQAYSPELVFNSGDILFLQNLEEITRSANTNETFQIIFEF